MKESDTQSFALNYCAHSRDLFGIRINIGTLKTEKGFYKTIRTSKPEFDKGLTDVLVAFSPQSIILFCEIKTDNLKMQEVNGKLKTVHRIGKLSHDQIMFQEYCQLMGFHHAVCYSPDDFINAVNRVRAQK